MKLKNEPVKNETRTTKLERKDLKKKRKRELEIEITKKNKRKYIP
jgi:hypothetical protein